MNRDLALNRNIANEAGGLPTFRFIEDGRKILLEIPIESEPPKPVGEPDAGLPQFVEVVEKGGSFYGGNIQVVVTGTPSVASGSTGSSTITVTGTIPTKVPRTGA